MKLQSSSTTLLALTSLSSLACATLTTEFPFSSVKPGETYELEWTQDVNYVSHACSSQPSSHLRNTAMNYFASAIRNPYTPK